MTDPRRSVLVCSYYFPPWGGGPVMRTLKLVKYLQPLGWDVCVLTAQPQYYENVSSDPELVREAGAACMVRTRSLQPTGHVAQGLLAEAVGGPRQRRLAVRVLMPVARLVHELLIPDDKLLWLPHAMRDGLRLVRQRPPDIIYVTTPPHSVSLLGLILSGAVRKPLVLDIRDDWVGNPLYRRAWRARAGVEALMERTVMHAASAILVPTAGSSHALVRRYPELTGHIHVVPNGFDEEDIRQARDLPRSVAAPVDAGQIDCMYTGLITGRRNLIPLFQAIKRINCHTPGAVRMGVAGFIPAEVKAAVRKLGISGHILELGYLPHIEAVRRIMDADVAVVVSTEGEGARTAVPSKLYEYIACGKPVLGLVDPGATRDLIQQNGWGLVCFPEDVDAIERSLITLIQRKQAGGLGLSREATSRVAAYSRRSLAAATAAIMETAIR